MTSPNKVLRFSTCSWPTTQLLVVLLVTVISAKAAEHEETMPPHNSASVEEAGAQKASVNPDVRDLKFDAKRPGGRPSAFRSFRNDFYKFKRPQKRWSDPLDNADAEFSSPESGATLKMKKGSARVFEMAGDSQTEGGSQNGFGHSLAKRPGGRAFFGGDLNGIESWGRGKRPGAKNSFSAGRFLEAMRLKRLGGRSFSGLQDKRLGGRRYSNMRNLYYNRRYLD